MFHLRVAIIIDVTGVVIDGALCRLRPLDGLLLLLFAIKTTLMSFKLRPFHLKRQNYPVHCSVGTTHTHTHTHTGAHARTRRAAVLKEHQFREADWSTVTEAVLIGQFGRSCWSGSVKTEVCAS